jgi:hypothetical protein
LNNSAESQDSVELAAAPAPGLVAPPNFSGEALSTSSIKWTWSDTLDEDYYVVHDAAHVQKAAAGPDAPSFTETGLAENSAVVRHAHAVNDNGVGPPSAPFTRATLIRAASANDFSLKVVSGTQIDVVVAPPPNAAVGSTGVLIERTTDLSTWTTVKPFSSTYSYSDSGLTTDVSYAYRVTFRNQEGVLSAVSPTKAAQPQASALPLPPGSPASSPPRAPSSGAGRRSPTNRITSCTTTRTR